MSEAHWRVVVRPPARKDLRRLDPPVRERVVAALEQLARLGPEGGALVRLRGRSGWRLRVGDWRAVVELDRKEGTIQVQRVLPRGRAYER